MAGNFDTFRNFVVVDLWLLEAKLNVDFGILYLYSMTLGILLYF
jgi:hypothetical protein